ncbi:RNA polymerase II holoenzyme cyclin-like subunit [Golovinomyces cichoracearum]|uniref:RNA polymerase II holoenzyme cyclin-like subunit n=1 Tax=Golovinomyces cichoracearum TaxID=62708 RepID=A0A420HAD5_9PEZI|nr:RNA polymerase II holoenzyme cyclin-like subunit [Golovinomyces cichoracearum]
MAASYWDSTQRRHWLFTKNELENIRKELADEEPTLVNMFPLPEIRHLSIYFNQQIARLSKRLGVRQQAMATAQLYIRRFYTKVEIRNTNPYLMIATAIYLACKIEECPHHIRLVVSEGRTLWPEFFSNDISKLGECEFFLISEMSSRMIVHHPYRSLISIQAQLSLTQEESTLAWSIINDQYMTDLPLLYAPHTVALMAILLVLVFRPNSSNMSAANAGTSISNVTFGILNAAVKASHASDSQKGTPRNKLEKLISCLAESNVDIGNIIDCTQELISFYQVQEQFNEKLTREQINRFIKARGLDK